jgi:hypothetical protein
MDMRFGTWNVRSMYRAGSLRALAEEISKYKLDLVGIQVTWDRGGTKPTETLLDYLDPVIICIFLL